MQLMTADLFSEFFLALKKLTLIPSLFFVLKMLSAFMSAAYIQVHFRLDSFIEANNMNPDQTAPLGAV